MSRVSTNRSAAIDDLIDFRIRRTSPRALELELFEVQQWILGRQSAWMRKLGRDKPGHGFTSSRHRDALPFLYASHQF